MSATAASDVLIDRSLGVRDAAAAFRLSSEAGWNQTEADWRQMLQAGSSFAQAAPGGLIATTLVLPYGEQIAWIAMVLTDAGWRGRGLASDNLRRAVELCRRRGWLAGLDATPSGREVYEPLGFRETFGLHRFATAAPGRLAPRRRDLAVRPLVTMVDVDAVVAMDAQVFGAERRQLLTYFRRVQPERCLIAEARGRLAGFVCARPGRIATQLGPIVADGPAAARALLVQALGGIDGPVVIDVPDEQTGFIELLDELGFAPSRSFTRMVLDDASEPGEPERCFAIAGPEFG
jgi:GNAT superfamily N-acetyltransferase